ncbi:MAG: hypothetical protein WDW36_010016 [Sanguina aurantia]
MATTPAKTVKIEVVVKGDGSQQSLGDCPFTHRVLLALEMKQLPYSMRYIDVDNKPAWLQEQFGGKVPLIKFDDGGGYLPDSDAIVKELEARYPQQPTGQQQEAQQTPSRIFPAFRDFLMSKPEDESEKEQALISELTALDNTLKQQEGPFLGGKALNLNDASVAPKLYHLSVALPHFKGWAVPAQLSSLHTYLAEISKTPEWQHTQYGHDVVIRGWERHGALKKEAP